MSQFEKDYKEIGHSPAAGAPILRQRKHELKRIETQGRRCKNGFHRSCLAQKSQRLTTEYAELDALISTASHHSAARPDY